MAEKYYIRQGAISSKGGVVQTSGVRFLVEGKPVAVVGDKVTCPACKKGYGHIMLTGHAAIRATLPGNERVALHGDRVSCDCPDHRVLADQQAARAIYPSDSSPRINNNVYIGADVYIGPGVHIGPRAAGAGSGGANSAMGRGQSTLASTGPITNSFSSPSAHNRSPYSYENSHEYARDVYRNTVINTKTIPDPAFRARLQQNHEVVFLATHDEAILIYRWLSANWSTLSQNPTADLAYNTAKDYSVYAKDAYTLQKLVRGFGEFGIQAYVKTNANGTQLLVLKGRAGLRTILKHVTVIGLENPRVVQLGVGKYGFNNAMKSGAVLSIIVSAAFRSVDYILRDEATMAELLGGLGLDVAKIGISTAAAWGAGAFVGTVFSSFLLGPLAAALVIGFGVSYALNILDKEYGVEKQVVEFLESAQQEAAEKAQQILEDAEEAVWDLAAAFAAGLLKKGKEVIEDEIKGYIRENITQLKFFRVK